MDNIILTRRFIMIINNKFPRIMLLQRIVFNKKLGKRDANFFQGFLAVGRHPRILGPDHL